MPSLTSWCVRLTAALLLTAPAASAVAQAPAWATAAPIPQGAEEVYGIAAGGKLHVFGGLASGWKPNGMVTNSDRHDVQVAAAP
jgi:hypothetical protein